MHFKLADGTEVLRSSTGEDCGEPTQNVDVSDALAFIVLRPALRDNGEMGTSVQFETRVPACDALGLFVSVLPSLHQLQHTPPIDGHTEN